MGRNIRDRIELATELVEWDLLYLEAISACIKHGWEDKIEGLQDASARMREKITTLYTP